MPIAVGIDIGNRNITIAVVRKKGIDIVVNDVSNRQTPTYVSFSTKERAIGEAGFSLYLRNIKHTITDIKRITGRKFNDADVQTELKQLPYETCELPDGEIGVKVLYHNEMKTFRIEQIIAMLLVQAKKITEDFTKDIFTECVISVPAYYTDDQRRCILDAAKIAGVNCVRLMNEHTATSLAYGIYKNDLDAEKPRKVMIIDMGHCATTVSINSFLKSKMQVNAVDFDWNLGGRNYDEAVCNYLAEDIKGKWKIDVKQNQRMWNRLIIAAEKQIKKVISSGVAKASFNVDTLYEERDYSTVITKETFQELTQPLNDRCVALVNKVLSKGNYKIEDIDAIEITGSGTRLSTLQDRLKEAFGKELSKTINCEESIARGCAIACAELMPTFKVKSYEVLDIPSYPMQVSFKLGEDNVRTMDFVNNTSTYPITRSIKFKDNKPIHLEINYSNPKELFPGTTSRGISLDIEKFPELLTKEKPDVKIKIQLDGSGVLRIVDCIATEVIEEEVEVVEEVEDTTPEPEKKPEEQPKAEGAKPEEKKEEQQQPKAEEKKPEEQQPKQGETKPEEKKEGEQPKPEAKPEEKKEVKKPKMKKITRKEKRKKNVEHKLTYKSFDSGLTQNMIKMLTEEESKMQASDKLFIDTAHAKNELESWIYSMKDKLFGELLEFTNEEEAGRMSNELEKYIDWLYEEGEDETKSVYVNKLKEAKKVVETVTKKKEERDRKIAEEKRKKEEEERKKREEEERKKKEEEEKKKKEEEERKKKEEEEKKKKEEEEKKKKEEEEKNKTQTQTTTEEPKK